jgi:hypothetical protein
VTQVLTLITTTLGGRNKSSILHDGLEWRDLDVPVTPLPWTEIAVGSSDENLRPVGPERAGSATVIVLRHERVWISVSGGTVHEGNELDT